ncbi:hypothetical protein [Streptomyces sp. NPDC006879]|uniref:hypothetical protein n=1 Tax=Streptomyces sp. NPDC006879 TaxID=3364767 RepID=UPI00367B4965
MTTATFTPVPGGRASGATALTTTMRRYRPGDALRLAKVFLSAAFSVAVLGEYAKDAGVVQR